MSCRLQIGINPFGFSWLLEPNEQFCTLEAILCYASNGLNGISYKFHTWEASYFNFDHNKIVAMAKRAAQVGVELLVLDDGWFGKRDNSRSSLGDWTVAQYKLSLESGEHVPMHYPPTARVETYRKQKNPNTGEIKDWIYELVETLKRACHIVA